MARFNPDSIAKHWPFNRFFAVVTGGFELPKKGYARIELRLQVSFFPNASRRVLVLLWPGVETRSLDAAFVFANGCNRLQRFATVCNRPQPFASDRRGGNMAVPMAISAKVVTFGGFNRRAGSFRVAGVALCDIPTCFIMYVR